MGAGSGGGTRGFVDPNALSGARQPEGWQSPDFGNFARDPYAGMRMGGAPEMGPISSGPGWDFTGRGSGEQFFGLNQERWMRPGAMSNYWGGVGGSFGTPGEGEQYWNAVSGRFNAPTTSESYFDDFQQNLPAFGSYYDRAKERSQADINDQLAARGIYGSSKGLDVLGGAVTDLEAQRANREADYMLAQAGLGGQLAGQADANRLAQLGLGGRLAGQAQGLGLERLGLGGRLAGMADAADLSRLGAGMSAATTAQDLRRQRGRDYMGDVAGAGGMVGMQAGRGLENMLLSDQDLLEQAISAALGESAERQNQGYRNEAMHRQDINMIMDIVSSFMGGGMGGGMKQMGGGGGGGGGGWGYGSIPQSYYAQGGGARNWGNLGG